jgi:hypothetical protein
LGALLYRLSACGVQRFAGCEPLWLQPFQQTFGMSYSASNLAVEAEQIELVGRAFGDEMVERIGAGGELNNLFKRTAQQGSSRAPSPQPPSARGGGPCECGWSGPMPHQLEVSGTTDHPHQLTSRY